MKTAIQIKKEIEKLESAYKKVKAREIKRLQKVCNHVRVDRWVGHGHNESYDMSTCLDCGKCDI